MSDETERNRDDIRSEARGPHWVAWVSDRDGHPEDSVVLVGETREEAEEKAKRWRDQRPRPPA
jgi:hypothetical protein